MKKKNVSSNKEIAEEFNNSFTNIASKLASDIQPGSVSYESFLPAPVPFSFFLRPTTEDEILKVIKCLNLTSPGYDEISMTVIKECSDVISPFLNFIINKCFKEGSFLKKLQIAKVIPIYKKGEKSCHVNYRPVSILPSFSKIIEKLFATRLSDYFFKISITIRMSIWL